MKRKRGRPKKELNPPIYNTNTIYNIDNNKEKSNIEVDKKEKDINIEDNNKDKKNVDSILKNVDSILKREKELNIDKDNTTGNIKEIIPPDLLPVDLIPSDDPDTIPELIEDNKSDDYNPLSDKATIYARSQAQALIYGAIYAITGSTELASQRSNCSDIRIITKYERIWNRYNLPAPLVSGSATLGEIQQRFTPAALAEQIEQSIKEKSANPLLLAVLNLLLEAERQRTKEQYRQLDIARKVEYIAQDTDYLDSIIVALSIYDRLERAAQDYSRWIEYRDRYGADSLFIVKSCIDKVLGLDTIPGYIHKRELGPVTGVERLDSGDPVA